MHKKREWSNLSPRRHKRGKALFLPSTWSGYETGSGRSLSTYIMYLYDCAPVFWGGPLWLDQALVTSAWSSHKGPKFVYAEVAPLASMLQANHLLPLTATYTVQHLPATTTETLLGWCIRFVHQIRTTSPSLVPRPLCLQDIFGWGPGNETNLLLWKLSVTYKCGNGSSGG